MSRLLKSWAMPPASTPRLEALVLLDARLESLALTDVGGHHHYAIEVSFLGKRQGGPDMKVDGLPSTSQAISVAATTSPRPARSASERHSGCREAHGVGGGIGFRTLPSRLKAVIASGHASIRLASIALVCCSSFCVRWRFVTSIARRSLASTSS